MRCQEGWKDIMRGATPQAGRGYDDAQLTHSRCRSPIGPYCAQLALRIYPTTRIAASGTSAIDHMSCACDP